MTTQIMVAVEIRTSRDNVNCARDCRFLTEVIAMEKVGDHYACALFDTGNDQRLEKIKTKVRRHVLCLWSEKRSRGRAA